MLDIPVRVKDALRDGRLLKNYKFKYTKEVETEYYEQIATVTSSGFTITETGEYRIGSDEGLFNEFWLTITTDGETMSYEVYGYEDGAWPVGTILSVDISQPLSIKRTHPIETEFTIDNHKLLDESVKINERLCSGDLLKFGLCEGSSLEFQYFGADDILGHEIKAYIDVQYIDDDNTLKWYYDLPLGFFTVTRCSRQASTGNYRVTAYNKLMSNYLDAKANDLIKSIGPDSMDGSITLFTLLKYALKDYGIDEKEREGVNLYMDHPTSQGVTAHTSVTFKLVGSSTTYTLDTAASYSGIVHNDSIPTNKMVEFNDLSEYIAILRESYNSMKEAILSQVQDPDTFLHDIKNALKQAAVTIKNHNHTINGYYTIPELFDDSTAESTHFKNINDLLDVWDADNISFSILSQIRGHNDNASPSTVILWNGTQTLSEEMFEGKVTIVDGDEFSPAELIQVYPYSLPDVTLRELQSAVFETQCQFGQLDRQTDLFTGIELNKSALYPADTLYPAADLYPGGTRERTVKSGYSKLWSESGNVQSWRYLIITYKGLDSNNQEVEKILQRTINANGTTDYNMSDNWLFKNLVWSDSDVGDYADAMVLKMQDVTWFPFEMWGAGLPYLETGDQIEVVDNTGETYTSYVLSRQLDGIQNLQDTLMNGTLDIF